MTGHPKPKFNNNHTECDKKKHYCSLLTRTGSKFFFLPWTFILDLWQKNEAQSFCFLHEQNKSSGSSSAMVSQPWRWDKTNLRSQGQLIWTVCLGIQSEYWTACVYVTAYIQMLCVTVCIRLYRGIKSKVNRLEAPSPTLLEHGWSF